LITCSDACVNFGETVKMLKSLEEAVLRRRQILGSRKSSPDLWGVLKNGIDNNDDDKQIRSYK
jgi:hypothetical protein